MTGTIWWESNCWSAVAKAIFRVQKGILRCSPTKANKCSKKLFFEVCMLFQTSICWGVCAIKNILKSNFSTQNNHQLKYDQCSIFQQCIVKLLLWHLVTKECNFITWPDSSDFCSLLVKTFFYNIYKTLLQSYENKIGFHNSYEILRDQDL